MLEKEGNNLTDMRRFETTVSQIKTTSSLTFIVGRGEDPTDLVDDPFLYTLGKVGQEGVRKRGGEQGQGFVDKHYDSS